jgi:hypothetical protein
MSSTGSLVMLGPSAVTPGQEAAWYGVYGVLLWISAVIAIILVPPAVSGHAEQQAPRIRPGAAIQ